MFEQTFVQTGRTNKTWTVVISFVVQCLLMVLLVILPMIYFDVLPAATLQSFLVAPPPPPPPPPPPAAAPPKVVKIIPRQFDAGRLQAPKSIPKEIAQIREDELPPPSSGVAGVVGGVAGGVGGGSLGGVLGGILGGIPSAAPPPPPPPEKKAVAVPQRIRVGGNVQAANLINQVRPIYPPLAKQARISGTVELSAIIGKDGRVADLKVVRGHPLPGAGGPGCSEELGLQTDPSERGAGRGVYYDRRELYVGSVVTRRSPWDVGKEVFGKIQLAGERIRMFAHFHVLSLYLLQEGHRLGSGAPVGTDGLARQSGRYPPLHHVGVFHRRDDRPLDGLQCRPQAIAAVRSGGGRRVARRQTGRGRQGCRPVQEEPFGQSGGGGSAGICRRTRSAPKFPAKRSKLPSVLWNAPKPSFTPS